jgi:hypothetical protein
MKKLRFPTTALSLLFAFASIQVSLQAQTTDDKNRFAAVTTSGLGVKWDVAAPNSALTLTVSAPDGRVFRKEFRGGTSPEFALTDSKGERWADGTYTYELRLTPIFSPGVKEELAAARSKGNEEEVQRDLKKRGLIPSQPFVQSGSFMILNGSAIVAGAVEGDSQPLRKAAAEQPASPTISPFRKAKFQLHHMSLLSLNPDQVIPDDLIVQGSLCAGLDCVNNENFGFDTIRVKENNTRIQFDDTSTSAGFATNNWQIRANNSASGGASFLSFVDQGPTGNSETGTIVFEVDAGAVANSLKVGSNSKVGLRTATPVLDLHANTTDTPAIRLEQNNSGGFTAQTWDIGANEANFFVRDVTGGSTLPFRIRPGAPTSSVDVAATGFVGIGTASPIARLQTNVNSANTDINNIGINDIGLVLVNGNTTANNLSVISFANSFPAGQAVIGTIHLGSTATAGGNLFFSTRPAGGGPTERMRITSAGNVGIATNAPTDTLSVNGTASKPGGGAWAVFSDVRLKKINGRFDTGLKAVMQLQPIRFEYKRDNALGLKLDGEQVGFSAQDLQKVIPEAVTRNDSGFLMVNNDPILWTMLNAIKEQQKEIAELKAQVRQLRAATRRRK